jgi:hypothetical protein
MIKISINPDTIDFFRCNFPLPLYNFTAELYQKRFNRLFGWYLDAWLQFSFSGFVTGIILSVFRLLGKHPFLKQSLYNEVISLWNLTEVLIRILSLTGSSVHLHNFHLNYHNISRINYKSITLYIA